MRVETFDCIVIHDVEKPLVDIIFVHGLRGDPHDTWSSPNPTTKPSSKLGFLPRWRKAKLGKENQAGSAQEDEENEKDVYWPRDFLREDIPGARVLSFGYDASISVLLQRSEDSSIYGVARDLSERTAMRRSTQRTKVPIIFIAHSLGGLIVKQALKFSQDNKGFQDHLYSIYDNTYAVMFFGTPHRGSQMASLGETIARIAGLGLAKSDQHLLHSLKEGSPELEHIAADFSRMLPRDGKALRVCSCLEGQPFTGTVLLGKAVEDFSSIIGDAYELVLKLHKDHNGMCKFSTKKDADYLLVKDVLQRWIEELIDSSARESSRGVGSPGDARGVIKSSDIPSTTASHLDETIAPLSFKNWPLQKKFSNFRATPTEHFIGRDSLLQDIENSFQEMKTSPQLQRHVVVLHGLGGIGKTQVALTFANCNASSYKALIWIDGRDERTVTHSYRLVAQELLNWAAKTRLQTNSLNYTRIAFELGLDRFVQAEGGWIKQDIDESELVSAVTGWLEQADNSPWLMIFDGVDDLESFNITKFFPKNPLGDILLTTRRRQASLLGVSIPVLGLEPEDATNVTMKFAQLTEKELRADCAHLSERLEFLPLALAHAGSYMFANNTSPSGYLKDYEIHRKTVLGYRLPESLWPYAATVLSTWEMSFLRVWQLSQDTAKFLQLASFLDHRDIKHSIFRDGILLDGPEAMRWQQALGRTTQAQRLRRFFHLKTKTSKDRGLTTSQLSVARWIEDLVSDDMKFRRAIALLLDFSLIMENHTRDGFSMHILVQEWCQLRDATSVSTKACEAVCLIARAIDHRSEDINTGHGTYLVYQTRPHLLESLRQLPLLTNDDRKKSHGDLNLMFAIQCFGDCLSTSGNPSLAAKLLESLYQQALEQLGSGHRITSLIVGKLCIIWEAKGELQKAENMLKQRVDDGKRCFGKRDPIVLSALQDLGANLVRQDRAKDALAFLEEAYTGQKRIYRQALTNVTLNLASVYILLGEFESGEKMMQELDTDLGPTNKQNVSAKLFLLQRLALSACNQIRFDPRQTARADQYLEAARNLAMETYGESDPQILTWLEMYVNAHTAGIRLENERRDNVKSSFEILINAWKGLMGGRSPDAAFWMLEYARYLETLKENQGASLWLREGTEILDSYCKDKPLPFVAMSLQYASWLLIRGIQFWEKGDFETAETVYFQAEKMSLQATGINYALNRSEVLNAFGVLKRDQGQLIEAEHWLKEALSFVPNDKGSIALLWKNNLATVYHRMGKHQQAKQIFENILEDMGNDQAIGREHSSTLLTRHNYALLLNDMGYRDEAIKQLSEAFNKKELLMGMKEPATLKTAITLGRLLRQAGQVARADEIADYIREYLEYA